MTMLLHSLIIIQKRDMAWENRRLARIFTTSNGS